MNNRQARLGPNWQAFCVTVYKIQRKKRTLYVLRESPSIDLFQFFLRQNELPLTLVRCHDLAVLIYYPLRLHRYIHLSMSKINTKEERIIEAAIKTSLVYCTFLQNYEKNKQRTYAVRTRVFHITGNRWQIIMEEVAVSI